MASIADMLIGGYESGRALAKDRRAEQNKSRLAGLFQQAYNAPVPDRGALVTEAIGIDPQAGMAMDASLQKGDTARAERLYGMSAALMQAPDEMKPQMYAHMVPELRRLGIPAPDQFSPEVVSTAQQVLQAFGGGQAAEQYTLSPGAARYDASGNLIAERPFAPQRESWSLVNVPDGSGGMVQMERNPATGEFRPPSYGNLPLTPPTMDDQFAFLGDAGATITSGLRSPERNREVGGVPDSFHLTGQARDILPPTDPQQAEMIRQEAAARGLEIIDEGDHWHLEPRGNASRGRLGYTPPKGATETPAQAAARADKERAAADKRAKAAAAASDAVDSYTDAIATIDALRSHSGYADLGTIRGDVEMAVPLIRTDAKGANAALETLKSQIMINTLSKLKQLSATGAAGFGALNQSEGDALRRAIANLDTAQSHDDLDRAVLRVRQVMERSARRIAEAAGGAAQPVANSGGWSIEAAD